MTEKDKAIQAAIEADHKYRDTPILDTIAFLKPYPNGMTWKVIISFDEYNEIGEQFFVVYHVDPETYEATNILI